MARGRGISSDEDTLIKISLDLGKTVLEIANYLGRSRMAIYKRIDRMGLLLDGNNSDE